MGKPKGFAFTFNTPDEIRAAAAAEVVALHDVVVVDLVAGSLVDLLVPDAVGGALFELVEVDRFVLRRRVEADRDVDQPEAERPLPDRACHQNLFSLVRTHPPLCYTP